RPRADNPDRSLGIIELRWMVISRPEAVFKHERGDAQLIHPFSYLPAFMIHRKPAVAAARSHNHRGSGGFLRFRQIDRDRWLILVLVTHRSRSSTRPEEFGLRLAGCQHQPCDEHENRNQLHLFDYTSTRSLP